MVCARYSSDPHASPAGGRLHGVDQAEAIMERGPDGAMISSTRSGDGDVCCLGKKRLVAGEALWMDRDTKGGDKLDQPSP